MNWIVIVVGFVEVRNVVKFLSLLVVRMVIFSGNIEIRKFKRLDIGLLLFVLNGCLRNVSLYDIRCSFLLFVIDGFRINYVSYSCLLSCFGYFFYVWVVYWFLGVLYF